ncbi:unnamed protein product [Rotaria magnacalcarata]|uniref:Uncharacterized protein n=2 Tax=Rotaria magnacalcarata TaxID=392030 RepID=A0A814MJ78_9BILA|nr:unnamed protein product [Rotaria magnacalcarata]
MQSSRKTLMRTKKNTKEQAIINNATVTIILSRMGEYLDNRMGGNPNPTFGQAVGGYPGVNGFGGYPNYGNSFGYYM